MEMSLANVAAPYAKPLSFARKQFAVPSNWCADIARSKRKVSVCAMGENSSKSRRQTLSSSWDLSDFTVKSASSLQPRFEDLDTTSMLLRQRIVFLGSQIDDMSADFIISQLLLLDAQDSEKDIKLFINTPGGSLTAAFGIYDAMKMCKADISTVCVGVAASMGAFLLAGGTKGKRFCMPNATVMIHQPAGASQGEQMTEVAIRARELRYTKIKMWKTLSKITGKPEEQIRDDTDRDFFMHPWQAKEYGLVDEVIDDGKPGLVAPITDASPPPKSEVWHLYRSMASFKDMPSEHKLLKRKPLSKNTK